MINISRSGILMETDSAELSGRLRPDEPVGVSIHLPRHPLFSPRCLECTATVVRVVVLKAQTQVAVEIHRIQVKDEKAGESPADDWGSEPIEGLIQ